MVADKKQMLYLCTDFIFSTTKTKPRMISYPNAKINLGLNIIERRPDGYHNLNTVFYPINLCDQLQILPQQNKDFNLSTKGNFPLDCSPEENLIVRTLRLIQQLTNCNGANITLHKQVPFGAGLGSGSSDASHAAIMFNDIYQLGLTKEQLTQIVSRIGADCPFFIYNTPCFAEGIGDQLTPITIPQLSGYTLLLVKPDIHVSTKDAYHNIIPRKPHSNIKDIVQLPVTEWSNLLVNDFESTVFSVYPQIGKIKDKLYSLGATYASMSGSGAAVFGIFSDIQQAEIAAKQMSDNFTFTQQL